MSHMFCRCGYLPRVWRVDRDHPMVGSVYVRRKAFYTSSYATFYETTCQAVGFRWGWDPTVCGADVAKQVDGVPLCKRHARVAEDLFRLGADRKMNGVPNYLSMHYLEMLGWKRTKVTRTFLRKGSLPMGRIIVLTPRHMLAVIDGVIHDTYDSSKRGTRKVQAIYTKVEPGVAA